MQRDNQAWLEDLQSEGERRDLALKDLRDILLRVLPNTLSRYLSPEDKHFDAFMDDVIQETLLRVLDRLGSFEGRSQFTTWVYKIAIRIALSELRLKKWKEVSLDRLEESNEFTITDMIAWVSMELNRVSGKGLGFITIV